MIFDSHMHVGEYPFFDVSLDRDGLIAEMREHGVSTGQVFDWDNGARGGRPGPVRLGTPFHHPSVKLAKVRVSGLPSDLTDRVLARERPRAGLGRARLRGRRVTVSDREMSRG
jgi:hypothetical protein